MRELYFLLLLATLTVSQPPRSPFENRGNSNKSEPVVISGEKELNGLIIIQPVNNEQGHGSGGGGMGGPRGSGSGSDDGSDDYGDEEMGSGSGEGSGEEADTMDDTIDNMLEKAGVEASQDVKEIITFLSTKNVTTGTMRGMLRSLWHEIPEEQKQAYKRVAHRVAGLHRKKFKAAARLSSIFNLTEEEQIELRDYMAEKKLSAIMDEAQISAINDKEIMRLKNLVQEMRGWGKVNLGPVMPDM